MGGVSFGGSTRLSERLTLVGPTDVLVYNPGTRTIQIWRRGNPEDLMLNHQIPSGGFSQAFDEKFFADLAVLIGRIVGLSTKTNDFNIPKHLWAYRFV